MKPAPEKKFSFKMQDVSWDEVLKWYEKEFDLTSVSNVKPTGKFTFTPPKPDMQYTIGEITDILNEALAGQKMLLSRRQVSFTILPTDQKVDLSFVPRIDISELPSRGKTELVQVLIHLRQLEPSDVAPEVKKMLTPFGAISVIKNYLVVVDTAGNVSRIVDVLRACEKGERDPAPAKGKDPQFDPRFQSPKNTDEKPAPGKPAPEKKFSFQMKDVPWYDVLEWYAKTSGLTPIYNVVPTGKFTFTPPKPDMQYTLGEITDIINEAMASQKYMLFRRQVSFTVLPTDEKLELGPLLRFELSDLPRLGKTEVVQVLIPLTNLAVEDVAPEVKKMLTPYGAVSSLQKTNTLVVVDTAGNIRRIVETLEACDKEKSDRGDSLSHQCRWKKAQEVADKLKEALADKDPGKASSKAQISVDEKKNTVIITAPPDKLAQAKKFIEDFDKQKNPGDKLYVTPEPEIRKYPVPAGTAEAIAKTLLAKDPTLKVIAMPTSNEILVYATPEEHFALLALLKTCTEPEKKPEPKK